MLIYKATSKTSGKSYIGLTTLTVRERKRSHKYLSKHKKAKAFHLAIAEYGWEDFEWTVLCRVQSTKMMNFMECHYIKSLGTRVPDGYNMASGGHYFKHSVESRNKMSESHKGYTPTDEARRNMSLASKGRKKSKETIARMTAANRKRCQTKEHREATSKRFKGVPKSEQTKQKLREANLGKKHTPESRAKMSKSQTGRKHSQETKDKIRAANTGYVHTPETRIKMCESQRLRHEREKRERATS